MTQAGFSNVPTESLHTLIDTAIEHYRAIIRDVKAAKSYTWTTSIQPLEEAEEKLSRSWGLISHLNAVANNQEIRDVYEAILPQVTEFHTDVMQDQELYKIYLAMHDSEAFSKLEPAQQLVIKNELRDFKLSGVHLGDEQRSKFKNLIQRLSELENEFSNNVLDATEGWTCHIHPEDKKSLDGIPELALKHAAEIAAQKQEAGWIFTLDHPSYIAILSYAKDRELRKLFYTAYVTRASDQGPNAGVWDNTAKSAEILAIRQQLAELIGFENYAQCSLARKMADNVNAVKKFLANLAAKAKPKARQEVAELSAYAKQMGLNDQLQPWDISYYSELYKVQHYNVSDEALRKYFPETRMLTALFEVARKLYNIQIEELTNFDKWHESVRMFKVSSGNQLRGHFYIDLYTREGKRGGAWMAECISRIKFSDEVLQHPIAYLNCNFAPPLAGQPGYLTHDDVVTLFHEFGHTLHHVLTKVDYYSVSGMNGVAWDAVELPSQFMENWAWAWEVIGDPLPRDQYDKLIATRHYQSALALMRQLEFAIFDLRIHENRPEDRSLSIQNILNEVREQVSVLPVANFNRFQNSFTHIFAGGYEAGYYSYLWAEVLSCDAFENFSKTDLFNAQIGQKFLQTILEQGGSKPAMDLFIEFAGREPNVDALLRHHAIEE